LSRWLGPAYGRGLVLKPDLDSLDALSGDRDAQWTRLQGTTFLTADEKRALVGYGPKPAELAHKYSPDQPRDDRGRWDDGGGFGGKIPREANPGAGGGQPTREAAGKGKFQVAPKTPPAPQPKKGEIEPKYKEPKPGQSGRDAKDDVPDWVRQQKERPGTTEDGNAFAKRMMDWKYPEQVGKHDQGAKSEWSEIKKWADSHFK
jgi:hypothetical protein